MCREFPYTVNAVFCLSPLKFQPICGHNDFNHFYMTMLCFTVNEKVDSVVCVSAAGCNMWCFWSSSAASALLCYWKLWNCS